MDSTTLADAPALAVTNLRKVYPGPTRKDETIVAVDRLTFTVDKGETYGLIGPNGAGKTTLLKMLSTLMLPTYGKIEVLGLDADRDREAVCGRVGFMPELFALYEELRVWEYLEFFAGAYGVPADKRKKTIDAVIELTDLEVRRDSFSGSLSKGMRQRLLLAKTLIHDPDLLILDEPTSGMDPQARIEFRNVIRTLSKMGKTIIISSHILSDLSVFCSSVGIMEQGRMRVSGSIDEVKAALEMKRRIEIECVLEGPDARPVLEALDGITSVHGHGCKYSFGFDGSEEEKAALLARLVQAGVQVTYFAEREGDLEEIFLQVGATQVQ